MTAPGGSFFEEFIDDFFSECDEHLAAVRRILLDLESHASDPPNAADLHDLQRALHTLKGLSGMVGLAAAEEIAHAMEDAVRAVQSADRIPASVLEVLFLGERLLETAVSSRRAGTAPPSPAAYVDRVRDVLRTAVSASSSRTSGVAIASPIGVAAARLLRFDFVPSAGLAARGVGVELIRQRLATIGEITSTTPRVRDVGGLIFEFAVALEPGAKPDNAWRSDGLTWETGEDLVVEEEAVGVVLHETRHAPAMPATGSSNVVRVDLTRLDDLMRLVGDLVISRARLDASLAKIDGRLSANSYEELMEANAQIERQVRTIREGVMRIRLVPIGEVFERMRFAMRDIARDSGKEIRLEFSGQETEIDKLIVDRMLEPLLHLVRNAAAHGIETHNEREALGKSPEGTIWLRARAAGDRIMLEVEDDGAGIDLHRLSQRVRESHGVIPSEARDRFLGDMISSDTVLDIICAPGFSTRDVADMGSGRGIGMAVVRSTVRSLGGDLFVASEVGGGTRFTIELPLTLMITDALMIEIGDQSMAIPQVALREILPLDPAAVTRLENNQVLSYRGRVVPLVDLSDVFHLPSAPGARRHVLIVGSDLHQSGLVVDRVIGLREIVVHPIADPLIDVPGVSGATELADGRVSLILDAGELVRGSRDRAARTDARFLRSSEAQPSSTSRAIPERTWA